MNDQPTKLTLFKKLIEFIKYFLSFLRHRKEEQLRKEQEEKEKIKKQIEDGYAKIDKREENRKKDDLQKRLDNLF